MYAVSLTDENFVKNVSQGNVLVDFYTDRCRECIQMQPVLDAVAAKISDKVFVAKINVDENQWASKAFNVQGIPMFVVFKNGMIQGRAIGPCTEEELIGFVEAAGGLDGQGD
jgi:thioredoxin 1